MVSPVGSIASLLPVTIESGESLSDGINLSGNIMIGVYIPASWTSADITLQASSDGVNFSDVYVDGTEYTLAAGAGQYLAFDGFRLFGIQHVKLRSGTAGAAVNQGADRTIGVMVGRPS